MPDASLKTNRQEWNYKVRLKNLPSLLVSSWLSACCKWKYSSIHAKSVIGSQNNPVMCPQNSGSVYLINENWKFAVRVQRMLNSCCSNATWKRQKIAKHFDVQNVAAKWLFNFEVFLLHEGSGFSNSTVKGQGFTKSKILLLPTLFKNVFWTCVK